MEKSKYDIKDVVFFIKGKIIAKGVVSKVRTEKSSIWDIQLHNDRGELTERRFKHEYKVAFNNDETDWIEQRYLYPTLESLVENCYKDK